jgi:hypothetical protein
VVVEGVRKEDSVSEQRLRQYRPGDEIDMVVHIEHAPMHLREVSARFFSKGQEEEAAISQRKFGRQLGERGFVKDKSGTIIWHGIGLRFDRPDPDHSPPKGPRSGPSESKGPDGELPVYKRESAESADRSGPSGPGIDIKNQI